MDRTPNPLQLKPKLEGVNLPQRRISHPIDKRTKKDEWRQSRRKRRQSNNEGKQLPPHTLTSLSEDKNPIFICYQTD
jgi:hypothetical protein